MYVEQDDLQHMVEAARDLQPEAGDAIGVFLGEDSAVPPATLVEALAGAGLDFFGGIFPGLIHGGGVHKRGALVYKFPVLRRPVMIRGLAAMGYDLAQLNGVAARVKRRKHTVLVLVDGMAMNISVLLEEMFNRFGDRLHYFGGGAGYSSFRQQPCLFANGGLAQDAALLVPLALENGSGVRHGWRRAYGPVVATRTRGHVIAELNWHNALEVYSGILREKAGRILDAERFGEVAREFPFGMIKEGAEDIVRDPLTATPQGELVCAGDVPENSVISILQGAPEDLIRAAGAAADDALSAVRPPLAQVLIADCISRQMVLGDAFPREVEAIAGRVRAVDPAVELAGLLTIGEISSYGEGLVEFFNKTVVVGVWHGAREES